MTSIGSRHLLPLSLAGLVAACASNAAPIGPCGIAPASTLGWTAFDEGAFTLLIPADFTRVTVQGIDSQVGMWEAPGKRISYDLGFYSNPLRAEDPGAYPNLAVCQEANGREQPRIIRWASGGGEYGVSAHWPDLSRAAGMTISLTLEGVTEREEDLGEILAVIQSVRFADGSAGGAGTGAAGGVGAPGSAGGSGGVTSSVAGLGGQSPGAAVDSGGDPNHPGYRAGGNEPFWSLRFGDETMEFVQLGVDDTLRADRPEPDRLPDGWRFTATANDQPFVVLIQDRRCADSMSGQQFPHTVTVTARGQTFTGCGGDTASLLTGAEWRVVQLQGSPVPGTPPQTLLFQPGGELTGSGGCNQFRATYQITGEGITIGPALATRRACADPDGNARETLFFSLLEQVTRFEMADDGALRLLAGDAEVIVARR